METQIKHLQDRIVYCTLEAQQKPALWPVVDALKSTLAAIITAERVRK